MKAEPQGAVLRAGPPVRDRVQWSDVDTMGIVYYGRYLRFIEAAESAFFRELGFSYDRIAGELGVWIARVKVELSFRAPARLDDEIACRAELVALGGSSLTFDFPVERLDGTRLVDARLVLAALDRTTLRARRLPRALREALS